jgi:hypothetical protein
VSDAAADDLQLGVVLGRADEMRAVAYLRLLSLPRALAGTGAGVRLAGTLRGPQCRHASTLPVTAELTSLPLPDEGLVPLPVGEAVLVEPGFWSPELPHRYRCAVQLSGADGERRAWSQMIGLRRLGHRGGSFLLDQRRYVPRCVTMPLPQDRLSEDEALALIRTARRASSAIWVLMPDERLCEAADTEGVMLMASLDPAQDRVAATKTAVRLAVHPSVGFLVVGPEHAAHVPSWRPFRGTLQIGLPADGHAAPPTPPEGIDFFMVELEADQLPHEGWRLPTGLPVVVRRCTARTVSDASIEQQRRGCDRLQADLAGWLAQGGTPGWEPAGYGV